MSKADSRTSERNEPVSVPLRAVRALFIARQHLERPRARPLTARRLTAFVSDTGGLQLDSINVVERAHYVTLWSRFGPYDRLALDRLVYGRRLLFEYWAHAACLIPLAHFPAWRRAMLDYSPSSRAWGKWLTKNQKVLAAATAQIVERGPLGSVHFEEKKRKGSGVGWWNWKPTAHALDYLWMSGRTLVDSRAHFQKRFDLAERVLPEQVAKVPLDKEAFLRWHVRQSLHAMGAATSADLRGYLTFPRGQSKERTSALAAMLREGEVVEISVVDTTPRARNAAWYALAEDLDALSRAASPRHVASRGTTLLTPFDSLLWYRERAARLFDFDYKIEVYTPGHQRVHGYYVLPIFHDGHIIGRVDVKNHRAEGVLSVKSAHFENWFVRGAPPPNASAGKLDVEAAMSGLADALHSLAKFVAAAEVRLEQSAAKRLGPLLKRALKTWPDPQAAGDNSRR